MTREKHPEGEKRLDFITACLEGKSEKLDKVIMATGWDRKTTWTVLDEKDIPDDLMAVSN